MGKTQLPPEYLPDGRVDEVRFLVVTKHSNSGHQSALVDCEHQLCRQYLELVAHLNATRARERGAQSSH
jgi:hypothetical protein